MMGQRAAASAERIYEILDEQPTVDRHARRRRPGRLPGRRPLRPRRLRLRRRRPSSLVLADFDLHLAPGRDGGPGRADRERQVDRGPAAGPLLRRHRRRGPRRRPRRPRPDPGQPAGQHRRRARRALPLLGLDPRQHRLRPARRRPSTRSRPRPRRPAPTSSSADLADGYDTVVGERGLHALGRPAPAHRHRPDPARQPARS